MASGETERPHKNHLISNKMIVDFLADHPEHRNAEGAFRKWRKTVEAAHWSCHADVTQTFNTADFVDGQYVFDVGGNKFRIIAVIVFGARPLLILMQHVLTHEEYLKNKWRV